MWLIQKGAETIFKQLPDNYQAKFELNLMSKFSNFIINKPFSAINNAARHIFNAICWRTNIYFINILKFRIQVLIISNN